MDGYTRLLAHLFTIGHPLNDREIAHLAYSEAPCAEEAYDEMDRRLASLYALAEAQAAAYRALRAAA